MAELSGSLSSFGLVPLVRFLSGLGKAGDLLITRQHWIGQLSLADGRVAAAAVEHEAGPDALAFVAAALVTGDFEFSEGESSLAPNLDGVADPLAVLETAAAQDAAWARELPQPTDVPRLLEPATAADDSDVMLGRLVVYVLLEIDGRRSVRDIVARHGVIRSLKALATLREMGLVAFAPGAAPPPAAPPPPERGGAESSPPSPPPPPPAEPRESGSSSTPPVGLAGRWRRGARNLPGLSIMSEVLQAVLVAGVLVLITRAFVQNFRVDGVSMLPTFKAGQALVVNRAAYFHLDGTPFEGLLPKSAPGDVPYLFGGPRRGDVVVFRAPPQPDADYIKRVIGLPGDRIQIMRGSVYINGQPLAEPYIRFPADYTFPEGNEALVVPEASYFVLGDNRPESFDSHLGWVVPLDYLVGRAWVRYWPPTDVAVVEPGRPVEAAGPPTP